MEVHCELSASPVSLEALKYLPTLLFLPPPPLSSGSLSAHPQPTISSLIVGLPVSIGVGGSPVSASSLRVQDSASTVDPVAPLWLLVPSSPAWPGSPLRPSGSTLVCCQPSCASGPNSSDFTSFLCLCPALSGSIRLLHPFGSTLVLCRSSSTTMAFRIHASASVARAMYSTSTLRILLVTLAHRLSVSASGSSATCATAISQPPWSCQPFLLHKSAPPWVTSMTVAWVSPGAACFKLLLSLPGPPWLLPPSGLPLLLLSLSWLLPSSSLPWTLSASPLLGIRPPPEPPPPIPPSDFCTARGHAFQEGDDMSWIW
ncbi:hypothetical protein M9458_048079, partial [Cirrhinus mrigala]